MIEDALELATDAMNSALERLQKDLARIRTGRATPALLDDVQVESYGTRMPLKQVASVSVADARLLVVKPFDRNAISSIEKGIINAQLGLNPSSDGVVVRVPIPPLTQERREGLVKNARESGESAKIAVRKGRRDANELLKGAEKDKEISEDELKRGLSDVQAKTDKFIAKVDEALAAKEKAILDE